MINFNAAQNFLGVIGLPVQQNPVITTTGNNNFQELITGILNNQLSSEKSDVADAISADPQTKTALFQSISMLNLLGSIQDVSKLSTQEIINQPAVSAVIQQNNLNPAQAQLLAEGIKITANEIISGNIQTGNSNAAQVQGQAVENSAGYAQGNDISATFQQGKTQTNNIPAAMTPAAVLPVQNQAQQFVQPVINTSLPVQQTVIIPQGIVTTKDPVQVLPPVINTASVVITTATVKPVQAGSETAAVIPPAICVTIEPITPAAVAPVFMLAGMPVVSDPASGKIQPAAASNIPADTKTSDAVNTLITGLQDLIKDFAGLIYNTKADNSDVQAKAAQINVKAAALAAKVSVLTATAADADSNIKTLADNVSAILATVAAVVYNITQSYANTAAAPAAQGNGTASADVLLGNGGAKSGSQGNSQVTVAAGLNQDSKDLISKIFGLLRAMNGQIYVEKKTYLEYNPASNNSSRIAKDGSLIINTAKTSGSPATAGQQAGNVNTNNNENTDNLQAIIQPAAAQDTLDAAAVTDNQAIVQPAQALTSGQAAVVSVPVTVSDSPDSIEAAAAQTNIVPLARNSDTAAQLLSGIKDKTAGEVGWVKDEVASYVPGLNETKSAQIPVNTLVFEKAVDFAGRVKEDIVIRQVVANIQNTVQAAGKTEIKMFLRPENMGPVSIKLDSSDNVLTGKIQVANTDVKDILKSNLPALRDALSNAGINVKNIDVSVMSGYIGGSLPDSSRNKFAEWEGAVMRPEAEETLENAGALNGVNGNLNFLA